MIRTLIVAAALAPAIALAQTAPAPTAPAAPAGGSLLDKISNKPYVDDLQLYGATPKIVDDPAVQFKKALRVEVPGADSQPWKIGLNSQVVKPVKAGDKLVLAFRARVEKAEPGPGAQIAAAQLQLSQAPYTRLFGEAVTVGPEWGLYKVEGKADRDYAAGELGVSLHLATGKQVLLIGPVFVFDMGQQ